MRKQVQKVAKYTTLQLTVSKETLEDMNKIKDIIFDKFGFKLTNGNVISYLLKNHKVKSNVK